MRVIKFRAWDKKQNRMKTGVESYLGAYLPPDGTIHEHHILMQFTGLHDKNGKEIYEGDLVKIPNNYQLYGQFAGEIREIFFNEGGFRLKPKWEKYSIGNYLESDIDYEVIGNIYEERSKK